MTSLGPAYIKLGQALSIRPDILSPAAMTELQKLCDKVNISVFVLLCFPPCYLTKHRSARRAINLLTG